MVTTITPDRGSVSAIGVNLMDYGRREEALAAGYRQGLALTAR